MEINKKKSILAGLSVLMIVFSFAFAEQAFSSTSKQIFQGFPKFEKPERTINFSGYEWNVKRGVFAPGPNYWNDSEDAVFVDKKGHLHIKITKVGDTFYSSEIYLEKSMGYGTYKFVIDGKSEVDKLDEHLILGLFLYQDDEHELDIELANWQNPGGDNIYYSVQPYWENKKLNNKGAKITLDNSLTSTYTIKWLPSRIRMTAKQKGEMLFDWRYRGDRNFEPGGEKVHINLLTLLLMHSK